jgi:hypothetical protein
LTFVNNGNIVHTVINLIFFIFSQGGESMKKEYLKPELVEYEELRNLTAQNEVEPTGEPLAPG